MSDPKKHHFVPQIYLNRFTYNNVGDLYSYKFRLPYSKVTSKNKSQVCYEKNLYRFNNDEIIKKINLSDDNFIEKNYFDYENSKLTELFDKIDQNKRITKREYLNLLSILLDIKFRNPIYRDHFLSLNIEDAEKYGSELNKAKNTALAFCLKNNFDTKLVDKAVKLVKQKYQSKNYRKNTYLELFLRQQKPKEDLIKTIKNWDLSVYKTPYNQPFITSDNPGFTRDINNKIHNTNFSKINYFCFPISPKSMIILKRNNLKDDLNIFKEYKIIKTNQKLLINLNKATMINSNQFVFSHLKEEPLIIKKLFQK